MRITEPLPKDAGWMQGEWKRDGSMTDEQIAVLRDVFAKHRAYDEAEGDCSFCGAEVCGDDDPEAHFHDCVYIRARKLFAEVLK